MQTSPIRRLVPLRAMHIHSQAALSMGWDRGTCCRGILSPPLHTTATRNSERYSNAFQMTATLQSHLRAAGMPEPQVTMQLFGVGGADRENLADTVADAVVQFVGWKLERVVPRYMKSQKLSRGILSGK